MKKIITFSFILLACLWPDLAWCKNVQQIVLGVHGETLKNISERLKSNQAIIENQLSQHEIEIYNQQSITEIKNALAPFGYFKPQIKTQINRKNQQWILVYDIQVGPLLKIHSLNIEINGEGLNDPCFMQLKQHLPLSQGDILVSQKYQEAKTKLSNLALQRGYFSAQFSKSTILVDVKKYRADVILHFNTGPRYYFGKITFANSPYCEKFLYRFIPFHPGEFYDNDKIVKLQENLGNGGFFQAVAITPKPCTEDLSVPIEINIIPRKSLQYTLGAGYGTDTGIRGLAGIQFRRINCMGHHLETTLQASERQNHWEGSYSIPGHNPVTDLYKLTAAVETQNLPTSGDTRYAKLDASHIRTLPYDWVQTLSLSLRNEYSEPNDGPTLNSTMLLPSVNWSKICSDNLLYPNNGYSLNINLKGTTKAFVANTNFLQLNIQGKTLWSMTHTTRLILRANLGYTAISDIDDLPITLQFYAGGAQSVRGYAFQGIGPGTTLAVGSIELQQKIFGNIYAAIFMDAGSVSPGFASELKRGAGLGLLWRSPVGAVEITIAQALDKPGQPRLIQFSMGPEL